MVMPDDHQPSATGDNHLHHQHQNHYQPQNHHHPSLHLSASSLMRAYLDSLPDKVSARRELSSYQFWKAARTELAASFLFFLLTVSSCFSRVELLNGQHISGQPQLNNASSSNSFVLLELKSALTVGLSVATLVQCFGHVSGAHLSIAITLGLAVSGRVSTVRLLVYLVAQILGSLAGGTLVYALFGFVPPSALPVDANTSAAQVFGFEFLATFLVVLAYLANADTTRVDLGFKALSIGIAYSVAHLFAFSKTGASLSPARALAGSLLSGNWCLHWVYWISPFVGGLFAGVTYEYVGSIKPNSEANTSLMAGGCAISGDQNHLNTELKHHQFRNGRLTPATPTHSTHSAVTSPTSNYPLSPSTNFVQSISFTTTPLYSPNPTLPLNAPENCASIRLDLLTANNNDNISSNQQSPAALPEKGTTNSAVDCLVITSDAVSNSNKPNVPEKSNFSTGTYSNGGIAITATGSGRW